ncbi:uncharacterized protein PV09_09388 [Verruconis gallopava]|uniref:Uncharacterized protein n=1 Tax=Verruconis gallopava TaxID=253628 RepID=A0A0D1ZWI7_9PEZI|nr:uncharacterized protein PV09_09388 [Verruconis gallopava]KIV98862.1 hypothetical protein PV09_09388 [Verruconis gallopava]
MMNMEKPDEIKGAILQDHRPFTLEAEIKYVGWLTCKTPDKTMSSIIIEFTRPEDANKIIDEGLGWKSKASDEHFKKQRHNADKTDEKTSCPHFNLMQTIGMELHDATLGFATT